MDTLSTAWSYIATLIVGGGAVALFNAWRANKEQKAARRADHLSKQLTHLYGPLHYLCGLNEEISAHSRRIDNGYSAEYAEPAKSVHASQNPVMAEDAERAIQVLNDFAKEMRLNNRRMVKIMFASYALIDVNDVTAFREFALQALRGRVEFSKDRRRLSRAIVKHTGIVYIFHSEFPKLIARRFEAKSLELAKLRGEPKVECEVDYVRPSLTTPSTPFIALLPSAKPSQPQQ